MSDPRNTFPSSPVAGAAPHPSSPSRPPHVVLVDDDADILAVLNIIFSEDGFRTTPCPSSEAAEAALQGEPADLLVTDLRLAGDDGLSLICFATSLQPSTKIILLTAARMSAYDAALPLLQRVGAEVVNKPFDIDYLVSVARQVTGWPGKP